MVVGKVMRWSGLSPSKARKFEARVAVARLDGLARPMVDYGDTATVRISCNRLPKAARGIDSYFGRRKRRKEAGCFAGEAAVVPAGAAEFGFGYVSCGSGTGAGSDPWEVSFSVLHGSKDQEEGKKKLEEIGKTSMSLAEWLWSWKQDAEVRGKKSQVQRLHLPITLEKDGLTAEATLYVDVSFVEKKRNRTSETIVPEAIEGNREEELTTDDSCTLDPDNLDLYPRLVLSDDQKISNGTTSPGSSSATASSRSSARSSLDQQIGAASKRKQTYNRKEDTAGSWESLEVISRDRQTKLKSQAFFASIDQRDESAGGESACTALVAVIANALLNSYTAGCTPTRSEFDTLIRQGSSEWQKLCNDESYIDRFPNKHFDLDTILEARIRPISVLHEKSFVGFFQPESFESLRGAMSFDSMWSEMTADGAAGDRKTYIVSWNDHFFLLKFDSDAYYIIDTLGERLFEGCSKAYMLKFEEATEMYRQRENGAEEGDGDELICSGKECCREFIKRFLAAIPLREELEMEEKGAGSANAVLHQRLQIDFHLTEVSSDVILTDDMKVCDVEEN